MVTHVTSYGAELNEMSFVRDKLRIWLFPIFYYRKTEESLFTFLYIVPEWLCIFKRFRGKYSRTFLFPVFYKVITFEEKF